MGSSWGPVGVQLGSRWGPVGVQFGPIRVQLGVIGVHLGSSWGPLGLVRVKSKDGYFVILSNLLIVLEAERVSSLVSFEKSVA